MTPLDDDPVGPGPNKQNGEGTPMGAKREDDPIVAEVELLNRKGVDLARAGQNEEALQCFEKALKINPNYEQAWVNKGKAMLALKRDPKDALSSFEQALVLNSENAGAFYGKGVALAHLGKFNDAMASYERSTELDPDNAGAWYGMGLAAEELGYGKWAKECFKKAKGLGYK